jgi:MFS family permease
VNAEQQQHPQKGIFINLSLFQFLSFVRRGIFYTFMINYIFQLMNTVTYTALLGTLDMAASALGQNLLWGKIADHYKLRAKLVIAGESTAAASYFIVYQIYKSLLNNQANFTAGLSLIIGLAVLEFFWSMSDVGWAALLTESTTSKTRGGIVGTLNFIASLGRMIGINFAGYLYNNGEGFHQGTIFYIVIIMLCISAAIMVATSKLTTKTSKQTEHNNSTEVTEKTVTTTHNKKIYKWFLISLVIIVMGTASISQVFLLFITLPNGLAATSPEMSFILTAYTIGGMAISLMCGWLADRTSRTKILIAGMLLAVAAPLFYNLAPNFYTMATIYGLSGMSFWTIQTVGFAFAGDIIPEDKRGRMFSRYNTVMALSWGPAGLLIGAPLADMQTKILGLSAYTAYVNTFYVSSIIVAVGTVIFALKVAGEKPKNA